MRLALTIVCPQFQRSANIVLEADPATPTVEIAAALSQFAYGGTGHAVPTMAPYVDGQRMPPKLTLAESPLRDGAVVSLGSPDGCLPPAPHATSDASLTRSADGAGADFNRPPRLLLPQRATRLTLPTPPAPAERRPLPILMAVLPLVMGVAMAYFLHQVYLLAMAGLSPLLLIGSVVSERRYGKKSTAARQSEYAEHKARIKRDAADALQAERRARREQCPSPGAVFSIAAGPRSRLWERRRTDPDYLLLRVGTADLPSAVEVIDPENRAAGTVARYPPPARDAAAVRRRLRGYPGQHQPADRLAGD